MPGTDSARERLEAVAAKITDLERQLADLKQAVHTASQSLSEPAQAPPPSEAHPAGALELEFVNETLRRFADADSQERILDIYLEEAQSFVQRAILFLEKEGGYVTWKALGFDPDEIRDISLDDPADGVVSAARDRRLIYLTERVEESLPWLRSAGEIPGATSCVPLVFDDTVPVVFYGDSNDSIAIDSLELLTHLAVLKLKNHYLEQLAVASGARRDEESPRPIPVQEPAPPAGEPAPAIEEPAEETSEPAAEEPEEPIQEAPSPEIEEPAPEPEFVDVTDQEEWPEAAPETGEEVAEEEPVVAVEPEEDLVAEFDLPSDEESIDFDEELAQEEDVDFEIDLDTTPSLGPSEAEPVDETEAEAEPAAEAEAEPAAETEDETAAEDEIDIGPERTFDLDIDEEAVSEDDERVLDAESVEAAPEETEEVAEPAVTPEAAEEEAAYPAQPVEEKPAVEEEKAAPELSPEDERKAHDEARRFARLLVSEVKLYNEDEVEAGRENGDLYRRLRRDIDRSREMYEKRVHAALAGVADYFHEELVRILAKGDEGLLGDDYPGPR